jgi:hypothetical protein
MFDEIMKKMILILHSNQNTFIYSKKKRSSNLEEKQYPHEGVL